jgi:hypothetical protein
MFRPMDAGAPARAPRRSPRALVSSAAEVAREQAHELLLALRRGVARRRVEREAGGSHLLPDLGRSVAELARVVAPGGRVALSGFARPDDAAPGGTRERLAREPALHVLSLDGLRRTLAGAGFEDARSEMSGPSMGYAWARRAAG